MNLGPRKIVISIAAIPAIRISPRSTAADATLATDEAHRSGGPRCGSQLVADELEADRARALDQDRVAGLDHRLGRSEWPPARRAPTRPARTRGPARPPRGSARRRAGGRGRPTSRW